MSSTDRSCSDTENSPVEEEQQANQEIELNILETEQLIPKVFEQSFQLMEQDLCLLEITMNIQGLEKNIDQALLYNDVWNMQLIEQQNVIESNENLESEIQNE